MQSVEEPGSRKPPLLLLGRLCLTCVALPVPLSASSNYTQQGGCFLLLKPWCVTVNQSLLDQTWKVSLGSGSNTHCGLPSQAMASPRKERVRREQIVTNLPLRTLHRAQVHLWLQVFTSLLEKRQKWQSGDRGQYAVRKGTSIPRKEPASSPRSTVVPEKGQRSPSCELQGPTSSSVGSVS